MHPETRRNVDRRYRYRLTAVVPGVRLCCMPGRAFSDDVQASERSEHSGLG
jgi:hypothetical protein